MSDNPKYTSTAIAVPSTDAGTVASYTGTLQSYTGMTGTLIPGTITMHAGTQNFIHTPSVKFPMFLISYSTESGDQGIVGLFDTEPTQTHLDAITKERYPDELVDGESYIYYSIKRIDAFEKLPTLS